ncbi:hypothetical protein X792_05615 [Dehalococcoides mccartyi CG1]|nr:hypothetical protein X792_05615 [Dehalococcoides mccartyi CG1]
MTAKGGNILGIARLFQTVFITGEIKKRTFRES